MKKAWMLHRFVRCVARFAYCAWKSSDRYDGAFWREMTRFWAYSACEWRAKLNRVA